MFTQEIINIGQLPNDGQGDPLRVAYDKINNNFSNLFTTYVNFTVANTIGDDQGQVVFEYPATEFTQGQFYIQSSDVNSGNSQTVILSAQTVSQNATIKFTGYSSTFIGDPITRYDMDVNAGNVRILINPLVVNEITHSISSQIMWANR